ncbi:thioesterase family protein [Phenylobacterium sp. NIBR 498073]|nr:acyl-CoA thioesterase domain-containing protein [Phenylobacterium sp. NIBR 498073]WGU38317.1 thioesterase family protein [Phenylobacterium sp. NIBR 498073]
MTNEPFFKRDGQYFVPTPAGRGPWNPNSLHGRVIIGLLGFVLEQKHGDAEFIPARLTVDMYKLPGFDPIEVTTKVVRESGRIRVIDAEFISGGVSMARATCQFLKRTENSEGNVWKPGNWSVPSPLEIPEPENRGGMGGMWASRPISGGFATAEQRRTWMSEVRDIVEGEPLTPFQRVAVACDFVSPLTHVGDQGLGYINSDVTLYLHKLPDTEWVGFESVYHGADDGVAVGDARVYDESGPIGVASCTALAQRRLPPPPPPKPS